MGSRQQKGRVDSAKSRLAIWFKQNDDLVKASGLPDLVMSDENHWYDFLEHGCLFHCADDPSGFDVDHLSILQKVALLRLLRTWPAMLQSEVAEHLIINILDAIEQMAPKWVEQ